MQNLTVFSHLSFAFSELEDPDATFKCMIKYRSLPPHIEAVFIQNSLKLFAYILDRHETNEAFDDVLNICEQLKEKLNDGIKSGELEVQERASTTLIILDIVKESIDQSKSCCCFVLISYLLFVYEEKQEQSQKIMEGDDITKPPIDKTSSIASELLALFGGELNPVAPKAQKKVPIPEGCVV